MLLASASACAQGARCSIASHDGIAMRGVPGSGGEACGQGVHGSLKRPRDRTEMVGGGLPLAGGPGNIIGDDLHFAGQVLRGALEPAIPFELKNTRVRAP